MKAKNIGAVLAHFRGKGHGSTHGLDPEGVGWAIRRFASPGLQVHITGMDDFPVRGRKDWPLPFDAEHRPKQAFWALLQW
jgi:hypothetical protein